MSKYKILKYNKKYNKKLNKDLKYEKVTNKKVK